MAKYRVFDLAKELDYDKNKLVSLCKDAGLNVKTPLSPIEDDVVEKIRQMVKQKAEKPEPSQDNVIRTMADLPSISSEDLEKNKPTRGSSNGYNTKPVSPAQSKAPQASPKSKTYQKDRPQSAQQKPASSEDLKSQPIIVEEEDGLALSTTGGKLVPPITVAQQQKHAKKKAMTEFERQQAKIQKRKKLKEKIAAKELRILEQEAQAAEDARTLSLDHGSSVGALAKAMGVNSAELIKKLMSMGIMASINQKLDTDTCTILAEEYGFLIRDESEEDVFVELDTEDPEETMERRDPIVTIMGHVDHGKTTLLDYIRRSRVAAGEDGGITQHIGAYKVTSKSGGNICFLDTPGHEAFTAMRAHGSQITDIVVLVVAADDGVRPQTIEAINHAKNAGLPIIVAITKCDKPGITLQKAYEDLGANGLVVEAWGGSIASQGVSGITGEGVDDLLDLIVLQSELLELKANHNRDAVGVVVEAGMHKGKGATATVLIQRGVVKVGDIMVAGNTMGRVRSLCNDQGQKILSAGPSTPVEVTGFSDVPGFADKFYVVPSEKAARQLVEKRIDRIKDLRTKEANKNVTLETLFAQVEDGKLKELKIIVKADVHGSCIALSESLEKIHREDVRVKVIHSAVGPVNESDVMLASASGAIIISFHVRPELRAGALAEEHKVEIRPYRIIYQAIEDVEKAIVGMLEPKFKEVLLGRAQIKEIFTITKVGKIAGCFVESGKIARGKEYRLIREGIDIYHGKIEGINRFKETVSEVLSGYECGINVKYTDIQEKDIIEVFEMIEIPRE